MISNRTEPIERLLAVCVYALLVVLIFFSAYQLQHRDTDIFWALRSGQWILDNYRVPITDPFSYTFAGRAWVDFTWGFQVIAFLFFKYGGAWTGLFILQLLVTAATFFVAGINLLLTTSRRSWLVAALLLTLFVSSYTRLFIRPHLFSYFFISLYLLLLNIHDKRSAGRGAYPWALYALVPLQVLWVNIHSSSILGIFIVGAYAGGGIIDSLLRRDFMSGVERVSALKRLVAVSIIIPLVSVLNPYGVKLALFPFVHQGGVNVDALRHIGEWSRIPLTELLLYFSPTPVTFSAFRVSLLAVLFGLLLNWRRLKMRDIILVSGAFYMAASHVRWVSQFAFFAVPIAGANLAAYFDAKREAMGAGYNPGAERRFKVVALLCGVIFVIMISTRFFGAEARANFGLGLKAGIYPEGNVQFLARSGLAGNLYNEYVHGGYLIFSRPGHKVFIDGRTPTVYSPAFFWSTRVATDETNWNRLAAEHKLEAALVSSKKSLCGVLVKSKKWKAVNFDEVSVLFVLDNGPNSDLIEKYELKEAQVCEDGLAFDAPDERVELERMHAELQRFLLRDGAGKPARALHMLGQVETELGGGYLESALVRLNNSIKIMDNPYTRYDYGVALSHLKRHTGAIEQFTLALKAKPGFKEALLALGVAYYDIKEYDLSVKWLKKYLLRADDKAVFLAYRVLGFAATELNMHETAVDALQRAAFSAVEKSELADIYFRLGNLFFEASDYKDGLKAYARAIETEQEYAGVLSLLADSHESVGRTKKAGLIRGLIQSVTLPGGV